LRLKPAYADAQGNLGKALYYQRRGPEAAPHFAAVLRANPNSLEALDLLARLWPPALMRRPATAPKRFGWPGAQQS